MVDVRDNKALQTWLATQPGPVSALIAARAAARVMPLIGSWRPDKAWTEVRIHAEFRFIMLRCIASSRFVGTCPNRDDGIAAASAAASYPALTASPDSVINSYGPAVTSAFTSALNAVYAAYSVTSASSAASASAAAARAATRASTSFTALQRDVDALEALNLSLDIAGADLALSLSPVAGLPLWIGNPPSEVSTAWDVLSKRLRDMNDNSEVWIDWYEAWRDGRPATEDELAAFALAPEELWNEPKRVNAWIKDALEVARRPAKPTTKPADLFISYATVDEAFAREVVEVAHEAGLTTIAQFKDFGPGSNFVAEMQRGLFSERIVAIYTSEYMQSKQCQAEWSAAYNSDPDGSKRRLLPLLFKKTELGPLQRQIVYKDVSSLSEAARKTAIRVALLDSEVKNDPRQALPDPIPVPNATVAVAVDAEGRIAIDLRALLEFEDPNPADLPAFTAAARTAAERASAHLSKPGFNGRQEYGELLQHYLAALPAQDGLGGDIIDADGLITTIREMLKEDGSIDVTSAGLITRCIERQQALRPHYPITERFNAQVRNGRLATPLPIDAARAVRDTITRHTPEIFAPSVQEFASSNSAPLPAPISPEDRGSPPISLPRDNSAPVNQGTARNVRFAELVNRIVEVLKFGKIAGDGTKGFIEVIETLKTWGPAIIEWLRSFLR